MYCYPDLTVNFMRWTSLNSWLLSFAVLWCVVPHASLYCDSFLICLPSAACSTQHRVYSESSSRMGLQMLVAKAAYRPREHASTRISAVVDNNWSLDQADSTEADIQKLAFILANVTDHLESAPAIALSILSQEMGWLYSRNVPK